MYTCLRITTFLSTYFILYRRLLQCFFKAFDLEEESLISIATILIDLQIYNISCVTSWLVARVL